MKILVLANRDIASCGALNQLLPGLYQAQHQVRCFLSATVGSGAAADTALKKLKHYEQDLFVDDVFPTIERAQKPTNWLSFNQLAEKYCDQAIVIENAINSAESTARISSYQPDLIISIRYGVILKEDVIKIPKLGVINLHSGKLPEYRGVMATFWAMLNNEPNLATTLHWIDSGEIDNGGIIASTTKKLDPSQSYLENVIALYPDGVTLILETVENMSATMNIDSQKSSGEGSYYSFPTPTELEQFTDLGYQLVNESYVEQLILEKFSTGARH